MKKPLKVTPVDPAALRGLASHAESHWLTFATAMKCYAEQPTVPALRKTAKKHGPTWLRAALRGDFPDKAPPPKRPREFDRKHGALAHLVAGAEEAMKKPQEPTEQVDDTMPDFPLNEALAGSGGLPQPTSSRK